MNDTVFVHGVSSENPIIQIYNSDLDSLEQIHYDIESENYIEHYIPNYMLHNENYIYWVGSVYYAEEHPQNKVHGGLVIRLLRSTLEVDTIFTYPHEMSDIHFKRPRFDYLGNLTVGYERTDRYDNELGHHKGMLKFDDDFNILHQLEVPFRHQHSEIVAHYELENGNYLFTDKSDTLWISGYAALHCMTPEGTQVWRREEISLDNNVVYKPIKSYLPAQMNADGNFIFISYYYDVLSPIEARLLCINPEGEVIWERYFEGPEDCDVNYGAMRYLVQDDTGNLTLSWFS